MIYTYIIFAIICIAVGLVSYRLGYIEGYVDSYFNGNNDE